MTNKEIVKTWFRHIDSKNFNEVKNLMDSKHSFQNPMTPTPVGIEQHLGMMQMMTSAFEGGHELQLVLESGDHVVVSGKWKGKHTGEFNGIPASNNPVEFPFIDIFHIVNGKVAEEHMEMNPMIMMQQIGAAAVNS
jgi:predicted ester cyclase